MSSYKELLKQREALELQISTARRDEVASAIAQVRAIVAEYELTQQEVFPTSARARSATSGTKVAPKYRDPASGQTWTGRGKAPKWIQGQDRTAFAINAAA
ncbi:MAG: H-NS histone family protein [Giesbergeria sp.]|nr:H-NS histone family protein [Giesbergeria sp.]